MAGIRLLRKRSKPKQDIESVWINDGRTAKDLAHALWVLGRRVVLVGHPYLRDPASGSGNCWCGRAANSTLHDVIVEPS